ncbi:MAG: U32 family peptidase [Proteobacteria bacterium]|nr:U32 family peptidase [Pseudomonadota bacterium]
MHIRTPDIELLAPAGDVARGMTAIACGADAVYIGAPRFSARKEAGNALSDIAALVRFAHLYGARVYVALNTMLFDDELPAAAALAHAVYDVGVDALIIADMGLLEMELPPIPLFASTQMNNADAAHIAFLAAAGFQRVILARELSLREMQNIRRAVPEIALESFVYGAACVGVSGRCYLSLAHGDRSGNRGDCAQPCRKFFTLQDARGQEWRRGHLLSVCDMDRTAHLGALLDAGITSFKIEGRLKDRTWLANSVTWVRRHLDAALAERNIPSPASRHEFSGRFEPNPARTFRRGTTVFGLFGPSAMGAVDTPSSQGEPVGAVESIRGHVIRLSGSATLQAGDGLRWLLPNGHSAGARVQKVLGEDVHLRDATGLQVGQSVFRNFDAAFCAHIEKTAFHRRIPVRVDLDTTASGLCVRVQTEAGLVAEAHWTGPVEAANHAARMQDDLSRRLAKTGDGPFVCRAVRVLSEPVPFVPVSVANDLRRRALAALEAAALAAYPRREHVRGSEVALPYPKAHLDFSFNVINRLAQQFYRRCGVDSISPGAEFGGLDADAQLMTSIHCVLRGTPHCFREAGATHLDEPLFLVDPEGRRLGLRFDCDACRMSVHRVPKNTSEG